MDLSNPEASAWYSELIASNMIGTGAAGWMADFGEYCPFDARLHGADAAAFHNAYPERWGAANRDAIAAAPETVFFSRSSGAGSPAQSTLFWLGDQLVTWDGYDGLRSAISGHLSGGLSGLALQHSDIGGYTMVKEGPLKYLRTKELLLRWCEASALADAVFRTHMGNLPNQSWQVWSDGPTMGCFARAARLHGLLAPLRATLMHEAASTGHPLVRALWTAYPDDPAAARVGTDQFLLGAEFLMAPVLDKGHTSKAVYLPQEPGGWVDAWTGTAHTGAGQQVTVPAPLGQPPIFVRGGSTAGAAFVKALQPAMKGLPCDAAAL